MRFFLNHSDEAKQGSPIEMEVIRVTHEGSWTSLKGYEREDRAVYHVDFRQPQQRDLVGHNHLQNEVIGAWICAGGQFVHLVSYDNGHGRPIYYEERPPRMYVE
jgi:hypothetical protein